MQSATPESPSYTQCGLRRRTPPPSYTRCGLRQPESPRAIRGAVCDAGIPRALRGAVCGTPESPSFTRCNLRQPGPPSCTRCNLRRRSPPSFTRCNLRRRSPPSCTRFNLRRPSPQSFTLCSPKRKRGVESDRDCRSNIIKELEFGGLNDLFDQGEEDVETLFDHSPQGKEAVLQAREASFVREDVRATEPDFSNQTFSNQGFDGGLFDFGVDRDFDYRGGRECFWCSRSRASFNGAALKRPNQR